MRKLLAFLFAALMSAGTWAADEGPWTRIAYKTGQTDLYATTSSTFNNLNGNSWANIIAWNLDFGIGYTISGGSCVAGTKIGVFSIYERQESLPSYTRKVLTWTYQIGSCDIRHYSNTALYGLYGTSDAMKNINVDFTYNYSNGAGSGYLAERYFNNTIDNQGHFTNSKTWNLEFDNRNGTSQVTKYWSLLLTHVIGFGANGVTDSFEWGCFKSISESWATYYYKYVSFDANGGSGSMSQQTVENSAYLKANAFSRTGYTFDGWATSPTGGKAYNNQANITATSTSKGPVTLYARWAGNTYTVNFDKQSGTGGSNSVTATYGSAMPSMTIPTRTGYTFGGYYTGTGGSGTQYYDANGGSVRNWDQTSNTTLYAKWTVNTYKVKFNGNGSTSGSMNDQNFTYGTAQYLTANAFSKTGYTFAGWATSADGAKAYDNQQSVNNLTATNGGTFNLYAQWAQDPWLYVAEGNVLKAYGVGGYTADSPLTLTLTAPSNLQFDGAYKSATLSGSDAWTAAGLTLPTIYYDGITASPSLLGSHTATITVDDKTATLDFEITADVTYKSFFDFTHGILEGTNYDVVSGTGSTVVGLNNGSAGVWWDSTNKYAVFDGQAYLQIDNPLGNVDATTGFTIAIDVYISSDNNSSGSYYRTTGKTSNKRGYQRLFDLSDGTTNNYYCLNAGNARHMGCARRYNGGSSLWLTNSSGKTYYNQWLTYTLVVFPGGYTTIYVNGTPIATESPNTTATDVVNNLSTYNHCYMGTSIWEAIGSNSDAFFIGKIRGYQTAEGALLPYYDGSSYQYMLIYKTNGGNAINAAFATALPSSLPTPTRTGFTFSGWYTNEALTTPAVAGAAMTENTFLYAKWVEDYDVVEIGDPNNASEIETFLTNNNGQTIDELIIDRPVLNNMYNTLCLPFDMNATQIAASSLNGVIIREFTGASVVGQTLELAVSDPVNAVVAGRPYFVQYSAASQLDDLHFEGVTINNAVLDNMAVTFDGVTFKGTFTPFVMPNGLDFQGGYLFLGQNNQLYWPNTSNPLKPFRAYFYVNVESSTPSNAPYRGMPARVVEGKNVATGVENVQGDNVQSTKVLENGVLYIIKNDVRYNAQGQIVK